MKNSPETKDSKVDISTALENRRIVRARQRAIGRELRRFFDGVAKEPVPEEFMELLRQMDHESEDSVTSRKRS
ncbi:MAG: hypothetical protein KGO02_11800 [Alphaproteobacteria bacterium]|nr:hypothetical protein [Alphaproteobacteria bacterium]